MNRTTLVLFASLSVSLLVTADARANDGACKSSTPSEATLAASKALQEDPRDLDARLRFSDALIADNCFAAAVRTLEAGEVLHGRNGRLQSELREARSMLRERSYFDGLIRAEESARLSHHVLRCNRFADIEACDRAVALKPEDPTLVVAKADALVQANRPGEALPLYASARERAPENDAIVQKIAAAEAQRREAFDICMNQGGQFALQSCQSALASGSADEFGIRKRTGMLLQAANQPSAALDSYIAASLLKPDDRSIASAIVTLTDGTARSDALTLAARGTALLTLGRALDALTPLHQALALSPDLPGVRAELVTAEQLAREEAHKLLQAQRAMQRKDRRRAATIAQNETARP